MHDSEYIEKNYRDSIRRNRQEAVNNLKREFGSGAPSDISGKEAVIGCLAMAALFIGMCALIARSASVPENQAQSAPRPESRPAPIADTDMRQKYDEALARRRSELKSLYYEYGRDCGGKMRRAQRARCDWIERRVSQVRR